MHFHVMIVSCLLAPPNQLINQPIYLTLFSVFCFLLAGLFHPDPIQVGVGLCFDWTLRLIGPLLLLFATGLISGVIAMYFKFVLPAAAKFGSIPVRSGAVIVAWAVSFGSR